MKLTKSSLAAIRREAIAEKKSDLTKWDDTLPGFGLRYRDGRYTWIFQYRFGDHDWRLKLGTFPPLNCDKARKLAEGHKGQVAEAKLGRGLHPAAVREKLKAETKPKAAPHGVTLGSLIPTYLDARVNGLRESTYDAQQRHLHEHWKSLHALPLANITRADVAAALTAMTSARGPVAANRARSTLSKFFRWAIGEGLCDANPVVGTNKRDQNDPRKRSLSDAETAAVWLGAPDNDYGRILKLLLLTGCRRTELGDLKWCEIDLEAQTMAIPGERTKNGQDHVVPLSDAALEILTEIDRRNRDYVFGRTREGGFSGWSKAKREFDKIVKLKEPWVIHDLRRTVRTGLGKLGVQPHISEAVLNHLPAKLITYDRNTYAAEKKAALDQWAGHIKLMAAQATGANVTALRNRGSGASKKR
jgi:integrase